MKNNIIADRRLLVLSLLLLSLSQVEGITYNSTATLPNGNQSNDIFNWTLSGVTGGTSPVWTGNVGSTQLTNATFNATFSGLSLAQPFWDTQRTWLAITGLKTVPTFTAITFGSYDTSQGTFSAAPSVSGSNHGLTVTWTAVPEPTSALAGLLLGAGLLRRKRGLRSA